jgi:hypothetical protein
VLRITQIISQIQPKDKSRLFFAIPVSSNYTDHYSFYFVISRCKYNRTFVKYKVVEKDFNCLYLLVKDSVSARLSFPF